MDERLPDTPGQDPASGCGAASRIDGRAEFGTALRALLTDAPERAPDALWMVDDGFDGWPLDELDVLEALKRWVRLPRRRLQIVGGDFGAVTRRFPRFTAWRRDLGHVIDAWQPVDAERGDLDATLLAGDRAILLVDRDRWRARRLSDPAALQPVIERMSALLRRCHTAWPVTTLGL